MSVINPDRHNRSFYRCQCSPVSTHGLPVFTTVPLGCPLHSPPLFVEYCVVQYEIGPQSFEMYLDIENPGRVVVQANGVKENIAVEDAGPYHEMIREMYSRCFMR